MEKQEQGTRNEGGGALGFMPLSEKVGVGGHEFTVTALPCGAVRREVMPLAQRLADVAGDPAAFLEGGLAERMLNLCHASVSRADPSITPDVLDGCLMLADPAELFAAVVRVSGLTRGAGAGEAPGPRSVSGATSTGSSQPPPAGLTPTSTRASRSPRPRT
jgi:hypothetical protein